MSETFSSLFPLDLTLFYLLLGLAHKDKKWKGMNVNETEDELLSFLEETFPSRFDL